MIPSVFLFKNAHGINQQHKLKPRIIFDRSFLIYSLLVQVKGFRSTVRTAFLTAIPRLFLKISQYSQENTCARVSF